MGNMLYQSCDNKSTIKGSATAKPSNAAVSSSLSATKDVTKTLLKSTKILKTFLKPFMDVNYMDKFQLSIPKNNNSI